MGSGDGTPVVRCVARPSSAALTGHRSNRQKQDDALSIARPIPSGFISYNPKSEEVRGLPTMPHIQALKLNSETKSRRAAWDPPDSVRGEVVGQLADCSPARHKPWVPPQALHKPGVVAHL